MYAPRLLPAAVLGVFALGVVALPVLRMRARSGTTGIVVHRAPRSVQRLVSAFLGASFAGVAAWTVLYACVAPADLDVWAAPAALRGAALALLAGAFVLAVAAQAQMGLSWRVGIDPGDTALVTRGLYSVVRNPIYTALLLGLAGVALLTPSPWTLLGAAQGAFAVALQARLEEEHLASRHGDAYRAYAARVGRFWPGLGRLPSAPSSP